MSVSSVSSFIALGRPSAPVPDPKNHDEYIKYLADDKQFLSALSQSVQGLPAEDQRAVLAAAQANVGNLTPEERAQIIASRTLSMNNRNPDVTAEQSVQTIERLANNQGYTGPDAGTVVTTTPTADGGGHAVTRGEILDNENFGNLVNTVFTAAGGKPSASMPTALGSVGMPGSIIDERSGRPAFLSGSGGQKTVDMSKWSEAERTEFLNKVAEFGKDGSLSREEEFTLRNMAMGYSRLGDSEPAAATVKNSFGKPTAIGKDDLMENGTFERQLTSMASPGFPFFNNSPENKALTAAIAKANYDELGYDERVALVQAFDAANSDHKIDAQEAAGLMQMLESFQKSSDDDGTGRSGTTLSNGVVVSDQDVATHHNFMSMVNEVLDRSPVTTSTTNRFNGTTTYGATPFSNNQTTVPMLRSLDVSQLTPAQRTEVLEMIAQAASDGDVTRDEVKAISKRVEALSGPGYSATFVA